MESITNRNGKRFDAAGAFRCACYTSSFVTSSLTQSRMETTQENSKLPGGVWELPPNSLDMELPCTFYCSSTRGDCRARRALFQDSTTALGGIHHLRQEISITIDETKPSFDVITLAQFVNQHGAVLSDAELTFHSGRGRGVKRVLHQEKYVNLYSTHLPNSHDITWSIGGDDQFYIHMLSWSDWGLMNRLQNAQDKGFVHMYDATRLQKWLTETGLNPAVNCQISVDQWSPKKILVSDQSAIVHRVVRDELRPPSPPPPTSPPLSDNLSDNQWTPPDTGRSCKRRYISMEAHLNL